MIKKILLISVLFLTSCQRVENIPNSMQSLLCLKDNVTFQINGQDLKTEVACSNEKRAYGLMNRDYLEKNSGMLFVFDNLSVHPFWMKNTRIPLSIAYIDDNWKIVDIRDMKAMDLTPVVPAEKALYAIETNLGWFKEHDVHIGSEIKLQK